MCGVKRLLKATLLRRGSTTGALYTAETDWPRLHRPRFLDAVANDSRVDAGFHDYIQCNPRHICTDMEVLQQLASITIYV